MKYIGKTPAKAYSWHGHCQTWLQISHHISPYQAPTEELQRTTRYEGWQWARNQHATPKSLQEDVSQQPLQWWTSQAWCPLVSDPHHTRVLHKWHPSSICTVILNMAHYRAGGRMPMRFFIVHTKNEIITYHLASTHLELVCVMTHESNTAQTPTPSEKMHSNNKTHSHQQQLTFKRL